MKKILSIILIIIVSSLFFCGCNNKNNDILFVMPDGAPSLSVASLMSENYKIGDKTTKYEIVAPMNIGNFVVTKKADLAILPLNLATKLCQDEYQILGITTFGNLYVVGLSGESLYDAIGHSMSVINLNNVAGLTLKLTLNNLGINYTEGTQKDDNIRLVGATANEILGGFLSSKVEYALVAEPALSMMLTKVASLKVIDDIQMRLGSYPQSVLVVKKNVFTKSQVQSLCNKLAGNLEFVQNNVSSLYDIIQAHLQKGVVSSLSSNNLSLDLVNRCNIGFELAINKKNEINNFVINLKSLDDNCADFIQEGTYYEI